MPRRWRFAFSLVLFIISVVLTVILSLNFYSAFKKTEFYSSLFADYYEVKVFVFALLILLSSTHAVVQLAKSKNRSLYWGYLGVVPILGWALMLVIPTYGPPAPPEPEPEPEPEPDLGPQEETIEAASIRITTTDGRIINLKAPAPPPAPEEDETGPAEGDEGDQAESPDNEEAGKPENEPESPGEEGPSPDGDGESPENKTGRPPNV